MQVSQAVDKYKQAFSPDQIAAYVDTLTAFAKFCEGEEELEELMKGSVKDFVETHAPRRPFTPTPIQLRQRLTLVIKDFLIWCAREGFVSEALPNEIEVPEIDAVEVVEILSFAQIRLLQAACKRGRNNRQVARDKAILLVLLDTGISARELCDLALDDVNLAPDKAYIKVVGRGGHESRQIDLGEKSRIALAEYVLAYRRKAPKEEHHVFLSSEFRPLTVEELTEILHHLRDESGIEGVQCNPDTFRQTFAVEYMKEGGDIFALSRLMGLSIKATYHFLRAYQGGSQVSLADKLS